MVFFYFLRRIYPKIASYSPPPISGCSFVNISFLYFHVLAAGYFHSLLIIRGRQFVPHRHPPSLQSFIPLHQLQHPAALVKNILAKRSVFYPCIFPYFPMVYLLQLRRVYPINILNISPPPFSCCSSVRQ